MYFSLIRFRGQALNWQHNPLGKTDGPAVFGDATAHPTKLARLKPETFVEIGNFFHKSVLCVTEGSLC